MKNKLINLSKIGILASVLLIGAGYAFAQTWQGPGGPPPNNNVSAPLNVSEFWQYKNGNLGAEKFVASVFEATNRVEAASEFCFSGTPADCISSWNDPSDSKLKTNLTKISEDGLSAIEKISSLNGWFFNWNDVYKENFNSSEKDRRQVGLIAQDVEKVLPEVVSEVSRNGEEFKTVDYEKIVPLLVEAIKEQQEQIEGLKKEIEDLRQR